MPRKKKVEQLSIFDVAEEVSGEFTFELMDKVRTKKLSELSNPDAETVGYFDGYGYGNKKGKVIGVHKGSKAVSYQVELTNGEVIYVHADELILLG